MGDVIVEKRTSYTVTMVTVINENLFVYNNFSIDGTIAFSIGNTSSAGPVYDTAISQKVRKVTVINININKHYISIQLSAS